MFSQAQHHTMRLRLRSSSLGLPSSSSRSAVSVGFKIWAMLPRRVGGAELSLMLRLLLLRLAEAHDQLPRSGPLPLPWLLPLANGGNVGGGVSGREWGCDAD